MRHGWGSVSKLIYSRFLMGFLFVMLAAAPQEVHAAKHSKSKPFEIMANDLMEGLAKSASFKDRVVAKWKGNYRIAVWPFDRGIPIPVPKQLSQSWNEQLLDALIKHNKNKYRFVSRTDLGTLISEVEGMDLSGQIKNPVAAVAGNAKVDVLIIGKILNEDGGVKLSYRAVDMGGGILATTGKHLIPINLANIGASSESMTLDMAIDKAAQDIVAMVPGLRRIRTQGLRFADTGIQTSFGRYVSERFTDALQNAGSESLFGDGIQVLEAKINAEDIRRTRGLIIKSKDVDAMLAGNDDGEYLLKGTYWNLGRYIQIRFVVRNNKGGGRTFNTRVHKASIPPGLDLVPPNKIAGGGGNHGYGPIGLELTSNKGFNPVFKVGEEMVLLLNASSDVFLTCFYHQADGVTIKAFPNKFAPDSRIKGKVQFQIPTEGSPFQFFMSLPTGAEKLRCFGSDKDPAPYLPTAVAQNELKPIPQNLVTRLSPMFWKIPGSNVTEVVMSVTVEE